MTVRGFALMVLAISVTVAGFVVGRATGDRFDLQVPGLTGREIPLPPVPPTDSGSAADTGDREQPEVIVEVPSESSSVGERFEVSGRFLDDGRTLVAVLKDSDGRVVSETEAETRPISGSDYGRFRAELSRSVSDSGRLVIEIMSRRPDGNVYGPDAVRVVQSDLPEEFSVEIHLTNGRLDPFVSCTRTFPVIRDVLSYGRPYRAAVEALLSGPTEAEILDGYSTAIPPDTSLLSLTVDDQGTARADFGPGLNEGMAGSCLVSFVRAQITATLKQFPEIREVVISVEGNSEDILQP
ncbi:GerMN domain-containing protein [Candidatus Uhrbacteria bacterium]|nr:GerMN domain-containing protein [Candidatus Uhrbacteria bacterium]